MLAVLPNVVEKFKLMQGRFHILRQLLGLLSVPLSILFESMWRAILDQIVCPLPRRPLGS